MAKQAAVAKQAVADLDPHRVLSVDEACEFLGISRPTIYRLEALPRVRLSPGRVGYRAGDLIEHARRGDDGRGPFAELANCIVADGPGGCLPAWFLDLPAHTYIVLRRRLAIGDAAFCAELPAAKDWAHCGHRELVLIDFDGQSAKAPMQVIAQEDEFIAGPTVNVRGGEPMTCNVAFAAVRLLPLYGAGDKAPNGWWIMEGGR